MTPMKYVKPQVDAFKALIGDSFVERYHNKCEPAGFHDEWENVDYPKTGIESDFIRLLRVKIKSGNSYSIGFSFSYIDKTLEESSVKLSIRIGNQYVKDDVYLGSEEMPLINFKDKMKSVNDKLSSYGGRLDYKAIFESLVNEFCQPIGQTKSLNIDLESLHLKKRVYETESTNEL